MPIDFNPNIMNHYQPQIVNQQYYVQKKEIEDYYLIENLKAEEQLLKKYQYDVLLITSGDIYLSDAHYGFLGGASCKISQDKMYFSGDLSSHKDYKAITNFLKLHNVQPVYNESRKLNDFGGIIQLIEKT